MRVVQQAVPAACQVGAESVEGDAEVGAEDGVGAEEGLERFEEGVWCGSGRAGGGGEDVEAAG